MNKRILGLLITLIFFIKGQYAQNVDGGKSRFASDLDIYTKQLMNSVSAIPSVAVVVVKDDHPVFIKTYGWADRELRKKADNNTLYYIASSTKSFTGLMAAIIDNEGSLKLDMPIGNFLKGKIFKN